ncbi:TetR family transcriptional regulator [Pseudonocardia ailaonensis]|uniref:TetR family transcriptional regulator n=1 Tax=Pseudonocardia ailaonensis TaxID=367279 RepID=A0ABN2NJN8_9PSEU
MDGLRERKKQQTRVALSWAAIRLVVERGLDAVRIEDIAEEAGVSLRTFRNYFPTKADAIAYRHLERSRQIADELRARPAGEPLWTAIREAVGARFALGADEGPGGGPGGGHGLPDPEWVAGVRLMVTEPALQGAMQKAAATAAQAFAEAVAARTGTDPGDLYPKLVAASVAAAVGVATEHWLRADPPVPMAPLLAEALDRLSSGLPEEEQ